MARRRRTVKTFESGFVINGTSGGHFLLFPRERFCRTRSRVGTADDARSGGGSGDAVAAVATHKIENCLEGDHEEPAAWQ
jgi:hypothetical protein